MGYIAAAIIISLITLGVIFDGISRDDNERTRRAGRVGLWLFCPPLGLWRSWKYGQSKRG
jgi:hypothetical protein